MFHTLKIVADRSLDGIACKSTRGWQTDHLALTLNSEIACLL